MKKNKIEKYLQWVCQIGIAALDLRPADQISTTIPGDLMVVRPVLISSCIVRETEPPVDWEVSSMLFFVSSLLSTRKFLSPILK